MEIKNKINFSRKHYLYPDLPKGFQITQSDGILGINGVFPLENKIIFLRQLQLEEDPAKLIYEENKVIVDYNRSGIALLELVTEPNFQSSKEVKQFLETYRQLLTILEISDTKKEGALRVDLNISVGKHPRVEIKNIGSDTEVVRAFEYEVKRQLKETDYKKTMETRNWDKVRQITVPSRDKETTADYRYMLEKNIPQILIPDDLITSISVPKLPWELDTELERTYKLVRAQRRILLNDPFLLDMFKKVMDFKTINKNLLEQFFWRDYLSWYHSEIPEERERAKEIPLTDVQQILSDFSTLKIQKNQMYRIFRNYIKKGRPLNIERRRIIESRQEIAIDDIIQQLESKFPKIWKECKKNKNKINYLVGQGIRLSKGQANPKQLFHLISEKLDIE